MRLRDVAHLFGLAHQLVVDVQAARGIEDDHIIAAEPRRLHCPRRDLLRRLTLDDGQRVDADLLAEDLELFLGGGTARVERRHQHFLLVALTQAFCNFCRGRGLTGALQPDHHDRNGRRGEQVNGLGLGSKRSDKLVVHDLHDHLARRDRTHDFLAHCFFAHAVRKGFDHVESHVGLDKRAAHLAHGLGHVAVGQSAATGQLIENAGKAVGQGVEHVQTFNFRY